MYMIKDCCMENKQIVFLGCFFVLALFTGCAKYKVQHVCHKEENVYLFEGTQKPLDFTVRAFDHEEFKGYLSAYQPLALHVKNKTACQQELAINDITLAVESLKNLKKKEPKLFFVNFIPCLMASCLGFLFWWEFIIPSVLVLGACGGQLSLKQHERAIKLLKNSCSFPGDTLIIKPYSSVDTLIFVKKSAYKPRFVVTIKESATKSPTIFNAFITARTVNAYAVR